MDRFVPKIKIATVVTFIFKLMEKYFPSLNLWPEDFSKSFKKVYNFLLVALITLISIFNMPLFG